MAASKRLIRRLVIGATTLAAHAAWAGPFDDLHLEDLQLRWDNTVTVSTSYALHNALPAAANYCALGAHEALIHDKDGACVYGAGVHTARGDLLSQVDVDATDF